MNVFGLKEKKNEHKKFIILLQLTITVITHILYLKIFENK